MIERKNCSFPDHAALSGSPPSPAIAAAALLLETMEPLGPWRTIVTPGFPPSLLLLFKGASSCPFLVASTGFADIFACYATELFSKFKFFDGTQIEDWDESQVPITIFFRIFRKSCARIDNPACVSGEIEP